MTSKNSRKRRRAPDAPAVNEVLGNTPDDDKLRRLVAGARQHGIQSLEQASVEHEKLEDERAKEGVS